MSRNRRNEERRNDAQVSKTIERDVPQEHVVRVEHEPVAEKQDAQAAIEIEAYRRCPLCWGERGGYGIASSTQGRRRFYKCKKSTKPEWGGCGFNWHCVIEPAQVVNISAQNVDLAAR